MTRKSLQLKNKPKSRRQACGNQQDVRADNNERGIKMIESNSKHLKGISSDSHLVSG